MPNKSEIREIGVWVCFFFSGFSGLIYEVVWTRRFELVFGCTTYAVGAVLTAFMGGLCLGSWAAGRRADSVTNPLRFYGLFELLIGIYAFLFPFFLSLMEFSYKHLEGNWSLSPGQSLSVRFLGALMVLAIPTALMGATLPFLSRFVTVNQEGLGGKVGRLYGVNTVGAVLGTLLSGFILLRIMGQSRTLDIAAILNLLLGITCLIWSNKTNGTQVKSSIEPGLPLLPQARLVLTITALSGFSAMLYETGYNRVLAMTLGGSVYAFSTMLAAFLTGLGLGALFISGRSLGSEKDTLYRWAWVQAGVGLMVVATGYLFERLPYFFMMLVAFAGNNGWSLGSAQRPIQFLISFLVMLPTALLLGAAFPLALRAGSADLSTLGLWVGRVYAWNTLGAILGSAGTAFLLIPWLGIQGALNVGVFLNLTTAMALAASAHPNTRKNIWVLGAVLVGFGVFYSPSWNHHPMSIGPYIHARFYKPGQDFRKSLDFRIGSTDLLFYREGIATTVSVERYKSDGTLILSNNGKTEASSIGDLPTQQLVSHLAILWRDASGNPPTRRTALVGLASGITAGAALRHPIQRLDVMELEPFMPQAAILFDKFNFSVLEDPGFAFIADDARHCLGITREKYDVIISEPSNPWISGVSNLFTKECFETGRSALAEGGVYSQWIQVYGLGLEDLKCIVRTFRSVFPYAYVFGIPPLGHDKWPAGDLVLLGSLHPLQPDVEVMARLMKDPKLAAGLERIGVKEPGDLISLLRMGPDEMGSFAGVGGLNTDDNARIEFSAPLSLYRDTYYENLWEVRKFQTDPTRYVVMSRSIQKARECLLRIAGDLSHYWRKDLAENLRERALGSKKRAE